MVTRRPENMACGAWCINVAAIRALGPETGLLVLCSSPSQKSLFTSRWRSAGRATMARVFIDLDDRRAAGSDALHAGHGLVCGIGVENAKP